MTRYAKFTVFTVLVTLVALPAFGQASVSSPLVPTFGGLSQTVAIHYYLQHPDEAPPNLRARFEAVRTASAQGAAQPARLSATGASMSGELFNRDRTGLPQNEETVTVCRQNPNIVLGGANDFRFVIDRQGNSAGWYFSNDGGDSVANEGLLPPLTFGGVKVASGGDPVDVAGKGCALYAADLHADLTNGFNNAVSGVGLYRSTPHRLASCPQGATADLTHPVCWPTRVPVVSGAPGHFIDKPWMDVGMSGSAGEVIWIVYSDLSQFDATDTEHAGSVYGVRCTTDLSTCTDPILISGDQKLAEVADVTIGPDGRVYVTWGQYFGDFTGPQAGYLAVAQPGSTHFSSPRLIVPKSPLTLRGHPAGFLHANDFRILTIYKNTVKLVHGEPRVFVGYDLCEHQILGGVCEEPQVHVAYTGAGGGPVTDRVVSRGGDNYFSDLTVDPKTGEIVDAYYTNRFDRVFHNRQDVEMVTLSNNATVMDRKRVTPISNETEADPFLGGFFIGDYIQVAAFNGTAYIGYNANRRSIRFLGSGVPVPQQDNFLARVNE